MRHQQRIGRNDVYTFVRVGDKPFKPTGVEEEAKIASLQLSNRLKKLEARLDTLEGETQGSKSTRPATAKKFAIRQYGKLEALENRAPNTPITTYSYDALGNLVSPTENYQLRIEVGGVEIPVFVRGEHIDALRSGVDIVSQASSSSLEADPRPAEEQSEEGKRDAEPMP